jgi:uncharacterized repeat protein (TIGR01451 family)
VFNFQVKPAGQEDAAAASIGGDDNTRGLDDCHRAVRFTVPQDGYYDVEVQLSVVGSPPDTHIYVVADDNGHPDTVNPPLSTFTATVSTVASGQYNTIAQNLWLEGGVSYWWYAERQSWGDDSNQFALYRGISGAGETTISRVMDWDFRTTHTDSYGNPFKMSWFMEMDNFFNQGQYEDGTPFDYLTLYNLMMDNWGEEVEGWGDEIAYHHHFMHWDGSSWVKTTDLSGYDWHNEALDYMVLDGGFFPTSFRSGWLWTSNAAQAWIERWMPIDYSNRPGFGSWGGAPTGWFPYHPSTSDYQVQGDMDHWIARCDDGSSQDMVNSAFAEAQSSGGPVIYCWYAHKRDDMRGRIANAQGYLEAAEQAYGVPFQYATAKEAMQAIAGCTDTTPPVLSIAEGEGAYTITSDEPLWGDAPYVAAKYLGVSGTVYTHTLATSVGTNLWQASLPTELTLPKEPYEVITATAETEHPDHPAVHAVDGNARTYWDSSDQEVPVWIQVDLDEEEEVETLTIHFWDDDAREYTYYVEASTDGTTWTEIVPSNTVHGLARHEFDPAVSMRYARVTVTANSAANDYAHIREIALYGPDPEPETFYLQQVGAGASDLCGNSTVITHTVSTDLSVTKTANALSLSEGDEVTYTVTVVNAGPDPAAGVVIKDALPGGVTYASDDGGGAYSSTAGVWNVGALGVGVSATLHITATVDVGTAGQTITNTAVISASDPPDTLFSNNEGSVAFAVHDADLAMSKTVDDAAPDEGEAITYTLQVTNNGPASAMGVVVSDTLPGGVTYVSDDGGGGYNDVTGAWDVGALGVGVSATLHITATVDVGTAGQTITNTAMISASDEGDSVPGNNEDGAAIIVPWVAEADLAMSKTVDDAAPDEGEAIIYTLQVENNGPAPATGVVVSDTLPGGVTYVSDDGGGGYNDVTGAWDVGALGVGVSATLHITATVDAGTAGQTITNTVMVRVADQADPVAHNDEADAAITTALHHVYLPMAIRGF